MRSTFQYNEVVSQENQHPCRGASRGAIRAVSLAVSHHSLSNCLLLKDRMDATEETLLLSTSLIALAIQWDPEERQSADELLQRPWTEKADWRADLPSCPVLARCCCHALYAPGVDLV
jgi:hypothetical protein